MGNFCKKIFDKYEPKISPESSYDADYNGETNSYWKVSYKSDDPIGDRYIGKFFCMRQGSKYSDVEASLNRYLISLHRQWLDVL